LLGPASWRAKIVALIDVVGARGRVA
jgi:hypothetical protein